MSTTTLNDQATFTEQLDQFIKDREAVGEARGAVLAVLRMRFAPRFASALPESIESGIRAIDNVMCLVSLTAYARACQSLDEFEKALLRLKKHSG